mgnify:FL=1
MTNQKTTELSPDIIASVHDLESKGFCYVEKAMDIKEVSNLKKRLSEQALAEEQLGVAYREGGPNVNWGDFYDEDGKIRKDAYINSKETPNQRVWMLVNKGQVFVNLLKKPSIRKIMDFMLGDEYILSSHGANIVRPGNSPMPLHTDQWWMPPPTRKGRRHLPAGSINRKLFDNDEIHRVAISPPVVFNVVWMLDSFKEKNGATRLVPGSHLFGKQPVKGTKSISVEAPSGTALILDGRTWHGTGANIGKTQRRSILTTFCSPQFRPQENYTVGIKRKVLKTADNDLRSLLGLKVWNAYGRIGHPTDEFIDLDAQLIGEIKPNLNSKKRVL